MVTELEPHRVSSIDKHGRWVERKKPHFPPDIDPFGPTPIEVGVVSNQIVHNRDFFGRMHSNVSQVSPEGNVHVRLNEKDDAGRICSVEIRIDYVKTRISQGSDATRIEAHRLFLYDNGVGVRRIENWVITDSHWDETILLQKFITEEDLHLLDYARLIILQSPYSPIK